VKYIILDRDGVINQDSDDYIKSPDEWHPIKGSIEAIAKLSQAGYNVVVLTNQSGIGRGYFDTDMLMQIHVRMLDHISRAGGKIECILFCPHRPEDDCDCRKPKAGLYTLLKNRVKLSFRDTYSVGDSIRDLQAAHTAGAKPVLVKTGNGRKSLKQIQKGEFPELEVAPVFDNLNKFVDDLLQTA
jgi:D-glycero-D-manno-heptose 1,7-bisphosphate phosphatase